MRRAAPSRPPQPSSPPRPRPPLAAIAILVVTALAVFANSLPGQFIYDDEETIVGNPYVRTLWPVTAAMHAPAQSAAAGRPLISLSLALNYALGGLAPAGYHAFNLVVHLTAALLLFGIVRRVLRGNEYRRASATEPTRGRSVSPSSGSCTRCRRR